MTDDANGLLPRTGIVPTAGKMILPSACRNRAEIPPHESWPESWGDVLGATQKKSTGKKFMVLCTQSTMKFRDGWNHANWGFWSFWVGPPHCIHPKPTVIVKAGVVSGSRLKLLPMTLLGIRKWNSFCSGRRQSGNALWQRGGNKWWLLLHSGHQSGRKEITLGDNYLVLEQRCVCTTSQWKSQISNVKILNLKCKVLLVPDSPFLDARCPLLAWFLLNLVTANTTQLRALQHWWNPEIKMDLYEWWNISAAHTRILSW